MHGYKGELPVSLHDICKEFKNISASPEIHIFVHTYRTKFALFGPQRRSGEVARVSGSQLREHYLNRVPSISLQTIVDICVQTVIAN